MKFLILLAFVLAFPSILNAQDYDEAFLESLPEEIKADLLGRADEKMLWKLLSIDLVMSCSLMRILMKIFLGIRYFQ